MRISTKRILSIGLAGFFLILAFFVYVQFIKGYVSDVNEKRATLTSKTQLFNNQNSAITQVQDTISNFQNFKDIEKKIGLAVPNGVDTISAVRQIEAAASRSFVTIASLNFKAVAQRASKETFLKKIGVLQVDLSATGDYSGLKNFLKSIETNVRIASVQEFKFEPKDNGASMLGIKMEMYYQEK